MTTQNGSSSYYGNTRLGFSGATHNGAELDEDCLPIRYASTHEIQVANDIPKAWLNREYDVCPIIPIVTMTREEFEKQYPENLSDID